MSQRTPKPTKADFVAQKLREDIAAGIIPPGDKLDQRDIAARFGFSPTPVREALKQLAAEGILVHTPNQGVTVADVTAQSIDELEEIYLMREALEKLATERAHEHLSRAQLSELARIEEAFREARLSGALQEAQLLNYSFHMSIYARANAPRLQRFIETLWTMFPWDTLWILQADEAEPSSIRHHEKILEGLTRGTAEEAGLAMVEHIKAGYEALRADVARRAKSSSDKLSSGAVG